MPGKGKHFVISVMLLLISVFNNHAQELTGIITGRVLDKDTRQPLPQAHIILESIDTYRIVISDSSGGFKSENIPLGRYNVHTQHLGFYNYQIKDQLVEAGNVLFLELLLSSSPLVLESLEISATPNNYPISPLSQNTISLEQSQRYAATFYDPARLATTFPGVASANDQANHISIRGHSPNFIVWRIDGLDFVNPNHLTNAGTLSDRPSINGGGVSILSAQLMADSRLLRGAFPASYGNSLSGIFDINLRKAEREDWSYTLQGGVLGIEAAVEGPFDKEKKGGFLANYRYSTIGLLSAAGLDVGDEKINFQDLAFKFDADTKKAGTFAVFGIGGLSNELFEAERDPDKWENLDDRIDTEFQSNMGGVGLTHQLLIGQNSRINNKLSFSHISSQREGNLITDSLESRAIAYDQYAHSLISFCSQFHARIDQANSLYTGLQFNQVRYNLVSSVFDSTGTRSNIANGQGNINLYQPFIQWQVKFKNSWQISAGAHWLFTAFNNRFLTEPRISIEKQTNKGLVISANYGLVSQLNPPQAYFTNNIDLPHARASIPNSSLGPVRSQQLIIGFNKGFKRLYSLNVEMYYFSHFNVPISIDSSSTYSILNASDGYIVEHLVNGGYGRNMGVDLSLTRYFSTYWYFTAASSLFNSTYKAWDNIWRNTRYNAQHVTSISIGKEFEKKYAGKKRIIGLNLRIMYQGGYWTTPIDTTGYAMNGESIYDESMAFSERLPNYFRSDFKIYFKMNKKKYTRTLSIDIQNITNRKNISYIYYDPYAEEVLSKYQLGFLPFITYRVEF